MKAVVIVRPGSQVTEAELIAHCRARLGGFECPRSVDFVAALPRNATGKVLKRLLREPFWADQERHVGVVLPSCSPSPILMGEGVRG